MGGMGTRESRNGGVSERGSLVKGYFGNDPRVRKRGSF